MVSGNKANIPAEMLAPIEEGKVFGRTVYKWNGGEYLTKHLAETARENAIKENIDDYKNFKKQEEIIQLAKEREIIDEAKISNEWSEVPANIISKYASGIILTSSYFVANRETLREIEFITAECVYGLNIFRDVFAGFRDIVGGRSAATQKVLRDARRTALTELRREALMVGADAVIAMDLDYQELSGGGKGGMLMIVASGTAVELKSKETVRDGP